MKILIAPTLCWVTLFLLSLSPTLKAQSPIAPTITLIVEPVGITTFDPIQTPSGHPFATDTATIRLVLEVMDTLNVSTIHVKLGTSVNGNQLLLQDFAFDVSTGLTPGFNYRREGFVIYLGLGSFSGFNGAYAAVSLGNSSGNSTNATAFFQ